MTLAEPEFFSESFCRYYVEDFFHPPNKPNIHRGLYSGPQCAQRTDS